MLISSEWVVCFLVGGWGTNKGETVESMAIIEPDRRCPIEQSYQSEWLLWVIGWSGYWWRRECCQQSLKINFREEAGEGHQSYFWSRYRFAVQFDIDFVLKRYSGGVARRDQLSWWEVDNILWIMRYLGDFVFTYTLSDKVYKIIDLLKLSSVINTWRYIVSSGEWCDD